MGEIARRVMRLDEGLACGVDNGDFEYNLRLALKQAKGFRAGAEAGGLEPERERKATVSRRRRCSRSVVAEAEAIAEAAEREAAEALTRQVTEAAA